MNVLLVIASIALSSCQVTDLHTVCFTDPTAPVSYAYDIVSREALIIEYTADSAINRSFRFDPDHLSEGLIIETSWTVDANGARGFSTRALRPDHFLDTGPLP